MAYDLPLFFRRKTPPMSDLRKTFYSLIQSILSQNDPHQGMYFVRLLSTKSKTIEKRALRAGRALCVQIGGVLI